MSVEVALATAKFAAVIITGIWAVIGLQVDFKDKDGRVTVWGRRALFWSAVSVLVAVGAQALETVNKRREEEVSAEKTRNLLTEIRRAVYPIKNVYVTANFTLPRASLPTYAARLEKESVVIAKAPWNYRDVEVATGALDSKPISMFVYKGSELYPARGNPEMNLLVDIGLQFHFFKKPIDVNSITSASFFPEADLQFLVRPAETAIEYKIPQGRFTGRFQYLAMNMEANAKDIHWSSNGKIASLLDLDGAQLIVSMEEDFSGPDQSDIRVLSVDIDIGGRRLFIGSGLAKLPKADPKIPTYSFLFPQHLLQADEDLGQDKLANDKIRDRAFSVVERRIK